MMRWWWNRRSLAGIPSRVEEAARDDGWIVRNRIIWAKEGGMPEPARDRLANRHEYILHLTVGHDHYYDLFGYAVVSRWQQRKAKEQSSDCSMKLHNKQITG